MTREEQAVYDLLNESRRDVMNLYGGNLDHPALDYIEIAMTQIAAISAVERKGSAGPDDLPAVARG